MLMSTNLLQFRLKWAPYYDDILSLSEDGVALEKVKRKLIAFTFMEVLDDYLQSCMGENYPLNSYAAHIIKKK